MSNLPLVTISIISIIALLVICYKIGYKKGYEVTLVEIPSSDSENGATRYHDLKFLLSILPDKTHVHLAHMSQITDGGKPYSVFAIKICVKGKVKRVLLASHIDTTAGKYEFNTGHFEIKKDKPESKRFILEPKNRP